jgi:hypothetical protein
MVRVPNGTVLPRPLRGPRSGGLQIAACGFVAPCPLRVQFAAADGNRMSSPIAGMPAWLLLFSCLGQA